MSTEMEVGDLVTEADELLRRWDRVGRLSRLMASFPEFAKLMQDEDFVADLNDAFQYIADGAALDTLEEAGVLFAPGDAPAEGPLQ